MASHAGSEDLNLPDLNGAVHDLAQYRGKWVVVNFWATWCPPCLEEIPDLILFHDRHKDKDAVVIGVNHEDISVERLRSFVEEYTITYPILRMPPNPVTALGVVPALPTTYLIDPEGEVVARQTGPITGDMIEQYIHRKGTAKSSHRLRLSPRPEPPQREEPWRDACIEPPNIADG